MREIDAIQTVDLNPLTALTCDDVTIDEKDLAEVELTEATDSMDSLATELIDLLKCGTSLNTVKQIGEKVTSILEESDEIVYEHHLSVIMEAFRHYKTQCADARGILAFATAFREIITASCLPVCDYTSVRVQKLIIASVCRPYLKSVHKEDSHDDDGLAMIRDDAMEDQLYCQFHEEGLIAETSPLTTKEKGKLYDLGHDGMFVLVAHLTSFGVEFD